MPGRACDGACRRSGTRRQAVNIDQLSRKCRADGRLAYPETKAPTVRIKVFEGIGPLGPQLGVFPKKAVPDAILDALFGQAKSTETGEAGGNGAAIPATQTYAILDAAKVPNLPELLERSGLEHRCLFKGAACDEMRDAAPWIVLLEEKNSFTRSDAPWPLWDHEPGIYVRSRESLDFKHDPRAPRSEWSFSL